MAKIVAVAFIVIARSPGEVYHHELDAGREDESSPRRFTWSSTSTCTCSFRPYSYLRPSTGFMVAAVSQEGKTVESTEMPRATALTMM